RIVVTTHRDLPAMVQEGSFRQDLMFRLNTHKVTLPPLRKRREDVLLLVAHFVKEAAETLGRSIPAPNDSLEKLLCGYDFPGNIRELRAMALDAAARYGGSGPLPVEPFQSAVRERNGTLPPTERINDDALACFVMGSFHIQLPKEAPLPKLKAGLKMMERFLMEEAMSRAEENQSRAAALLGLSRQAFYKRFRSNES
ncbi:MAG: sigma 54-interacting transcriptional regulator, partial [Magnetococcales bacterium]|nr:sigma 54-interacting transcriptional regulator [Magnetococcales bacterium]